jgi:hypothetical protein
MFLIREEYKKEVKGKEEDWVEENSVVQEFTMDFDDVLE